MRIVTRYALWRGPLEAGPVPLDLPVGARVLTVQLLGRELRLWAREHPDVLKELRTFTIVGDGGVVSHLSPYVGTVIDVDGLCWHVFGPEPLS